MDPGNGGRAGMVGRLMHAPLTSLFMARLDPATGTLDYCSAGHPPALLLRENGRPEFGFEGREAHLRHARTGSAEAVLFSILAAVQDFAAPHALVDDTSLVVIRRRGGPHTRAD